MSNARGSRREHVEAVGGVWLPSKGIKVILGLYGNSIGGTLVAPVTNANMSPVATPHSVKKIVTYLSLPLSYLRTHKCNPSDLI